MLRHVREQVERELAELEGDRREEPTRSLLDVTAVEFGDTDRVSVCGRADDEELLSSVLEGYDGYELTGERGCPGGVVVEGSNPRARMNNTFDSVLDTVWEDSLKEVGARLFDGR